MSKLLKFPPTLKISEKVQMAAYRRNTNKDGERNGIVVSYVGQ